MTKESPTYNETDVDNITAKYIEYFGQKFFKKSYFTEEPTENIRNFMLADSTTISYKKLITAFGSNRNEFNEKLGNLLDGKNNLNFRENRLSFGFNPWMDYLFYDYFKEDKDRPVEGIILVVGQDFYPLNLSLYNPLVIEEQILHQTKRNGEHTKNQNKYVKFFDLITKKNHLPIFINLVIGLRTDNDKEGDFSEYHRMDFFEDVLLEFSKKSLPITIVTWGIPVLNSFQNKYPELSHFIKKNGEKCQKGIQKIPINGKSHQIIPMYHPASRGHWTNEETNEPQRKALTKLLQKSPASVS